MVGEFTQSTIDRTADFLQHVLLRIEGRWEGGPSSLPAVPAAADIWPRRWVLAAAWEQSPPLLRRHQAAPQSPTSRPRRRLTIRLPALSGFVPYSAHCRIERQRAPKPPFLFPQRTRSHRISLRSAEFEDSSNRRHHPTPPGGSPGREWLVAPWPRWCLEPRLLTHSGSRHPWTAA